MYPSSRVIILSDNCRFVHRLNITHWPTTYTRGVTVELTDKRYLSDVCRQMTTFRKKHLPLSSSQKYVGRDKMVVTREIVRREATLIGQMGVDGLEMDPALLTSSLKNEAIDTSEKF